MKINKTFQVIGLLVLVVFVTLATNLIINKSSLSKQSEDRKSVV